MKVGISVALIFVLGGGGLASARAEDGCSAVLKFEIWNTRDTSDAVADFSRLQTGHATPAVRPPGAVSLMDHFISTCQREVPQIHVQVVIADIFFYINIKIQ